jgi:hypothetical protein
LNISVDAVRTPVDRRVRCMVLESIPIDLTLLSPFTEQISREDIEEMQ